MPPIHVILIAAALLGIAVRGLAIPIAQPLVPVMENFDSLAASGAGTALPTGWTFTETGSAANLTYAAGTGSSTVGDTYSLGTAGASDRALGTLQSSSVSTVLGASFLNTTALTLTELTLSYVGEQWRLGALGRVDRLDFAYSLDGTTWTDLDALDFTAPVTAGTVGALDGNMAANRMALSHTLTGLAIAPGAGFWIRWSDYPAAGADDVLAIDDFSLVARASATTADVPESVSPVVAFAGVLGMLWLWRARRSRSAAAPFT
jgi:hypothetical protein